MKNLILSEEKIKEQLLRIYEIAFEDGQNDDNRYMHDAVNECFENLKPSESTECDMPVVGQSLANSCKRCGVEMNDDMELCYECYYD